MLKKTKTPTPPRLGTPMPAGAQEDESSGRLPCRWKGRLLLSSQSTRW